MSKHPVAILNTSIITSEGTFSLKSITLEQAQQLVKDNEILSAVGHQSTAEILTELLGIKISVNRIQFEQQDGQQALVFKLNGRPQEGKILSREEIEDIGYEFQLLTRHDAIYAVVSLNRVVTATLDKEYAEEQCLQGLDGTMTKWVKNSKTEEISQEKLVRERYKKNSLALPNINWEKLIEDYVEDGEYYAGFTEVIMSESSAASDGIISIGIWLDKGKEGNITRICFFLAKKDLNKVLRNPNYISELVEAGKYETNWQNSLNPCYYGTIVIPT